MVFPLLWIVRQAKKATIIGPGGDERDGVASQDAPEWPGEIRLAQRQNAQNRSVCARSPA